jgi:hypothetical protein
MQLRANSFPEFRVAYTFNLPAGGRLLEERRRFAMIHIRPLVLSLRASIRPIDLIFSSQYRNEAPGDAYVDVVTATHATQRDATPAGNPRAIFRSLESLKSEEAKKEAGFF